MSELLYDSEAALRLLDGALDELCGPGGEEPRAPRASVSQPEVA